MLCLIIWFIVFELKQHIAQFLHCIWLVETCFDVTIKCSCNISEHFAIQFQSAICLLFSKRFSYLIWPMLQLAAHDSLTWPSEASGGPGQPVAACIWWNMMKLWLILLWPVFMTIPILMITRGLVIKNYQMKMKQWEICRSSATYDLWLKAESWSLNYKIQKF